MKDIYAILTQLKISYERYEHPAVFTVKEASYYDKGTNAGRSKNLFLRNKKGDRHYLIVAESTKTIDLKKLASMMGESKLSFASSERLQMCLALKPGSVSPFGLINDLYKSVWVIVDKGLLEHKKLGFHPNTNTSTLVIGANDFKRFLAWAGNKVTILEL